jgi:hypothetical protein
LLLGVLKLLDESRMISELDEVDDEEDVDEAEPDTD